LNNKSFRLLGLIRLEVKEQTQVEVVRMIENPSWQQHNGNNIPIMSNNEFNLFLRRYLENSDLSDKACNQIKKQLVDSGFLLAFDKLVVLKPQWLADTFKAIISFNNIDDKKEKSGILKKDQIIQRLGFEEEICNKLINIWEKELNACITHPISPNRYIIPSLLDEVRPQKLEKQWKEAKVKSNCVGRIYSLPFLPAGIFEGIFVKIFGIYPAIEFWRNGLLLHKMEFKDQSESFLLLEITTNGNSRIHSTQYKITIQATGKFIFWFIFNLLE
jgi:hypothetical protein